MLSSAGAESSPARSVSTDIARCAGGWVPALVDADPIPIAWMWPHRGMITRAPVILIPNLIGNTRLDRIRRCTTHGLPVIENSATLSCTLRAATGGFHAERDELRHSHLTFAGTRMVIDRRR